MFKVRYLCYNKRNNELRDIAKAILSAYSAHSTRTIFRGWCGMAQAVVELQPLYRSTEDQLTDVLRVVTALGHNDRDNSWLLLEDNAYNRWGELTERVSLEFHDSYAILIIQQN